MTDLGLHTRKEDLVKESLTRDDFESVPGSGISAQ